MLFLKIDRERQRQINRETQRHTLCSSLLLSSSSSFCLLFSSLLFHSLLFASLLFSSLLFSSLLFSSSRLFSSSLSPLSSKVINSQISILSNNSKVLPLTRREAQRVNCSCVSKRKRLQIFLFLMVSSVCFYLPPQMFHTDTGFTSLSGVWKTEPL